MPTQDYSAVNEVVATTPPGSPAAELYPNIAQTNLSTVSTSIDLTAVDNALRADANANAHLNDTHTLGDPTNTVSRIDISNAVGTAFHVVGNGFDDAGFGTGVKWQFLYGTVADNLIVSAETPNVFINTGSGNDVLAGLSGNNVLDGGSGRDTYYSGTGGSNIFIGDMRSGHPATMQINNMHSGDTAVMLGGVNSIEEAFQNGGLDVEYKDAGGAVLGQITVLGSVVGSLQIGAATSSTGIHFQFVHFA